jgi:glycosyltransferase involved in cell wall biosynthesis
MLRLGRDAVWQASSEGEAENISAAMGEHSRIFVAPDITSPLPKRNDAAAPTGRKIAGTARMVFLSRISPKKNLEHALTTLGNVPEGQIDFDIYGPVEDGAYWARCRKLISSINRPSVQVTYRGEIPHSQVQSVLSRYDLMVLPTLGENFGHIIYEAMAAGCPVAISDETPWNEVAVAGAGWVSPLADQDGWIAAFAHVVNADEDEQERLRGGARRLAEQYGYRQEDIAMSRDLFLRSLG